MQSERIQTKMSCATLQVSRSGYYAWRHRSMSQRRQSNEALLAEIRRIHQESKETYGAPRITAQLKTEGISCSKNRVARLMKQAGIIGVATKRHKVQTTDSRHDLPIAARVFQTEDKQTHPQAPNEVWASDVSYIDTQEGWLYLCIFLDLFTRKVVGWATADHMKTELILQALNEALLTQNPNGKKLISHSDRGVQYAAQALRDRLACLSITASMSRKGNCYDNAYAESFFHTLKVELIHRKQFKTRKEATTALFEYIETWYNKKRLHSSLGFQSPENYEKLFLAA